MQSFDLWHLESWIHWTHSEVYTDWACLGNMVRRAVLCFLLGLKVRKSDMDPLKNRVWKTMSMLKCVEHCNFGFHMVPWRLSGDFPWLRQGSSSLYVNWGANSACWLGMMSLAWSAYILLQTTWFLGCAGIERATSMVTTWVEVGKHPKTKWSWWVASHKQFWQLTVEHFPSGAFPAWLVRRSDQKATGTLLALIRRGGNPWVKRLNPTKTVTCVCVTTCFTYLG